MVKTEGMRGRLDGMRQEVVDKVEGMRGMRERGWRALGICGEHVGNLRESHNVRGCGGEKRG